MASQSDEYPTVHGRDQSLADGMALGQRSQSRVGVENGVGVVVWMPALALVDDCRPGLGRRSCKCRSTLHIKLLYIRC